MLINDDCINALKNIKTKSIDLILTDPPYGISKKSNFNRTSEHKPQILKDKFNYSIDFGDWDNTDIDYDELFSEFYRVLKKGGTLIIFYDIWKSNIIKEYATKYKFKQPRIGQWIKTNPVPLNSSYNYLSNCSEFFFTFVKIEKPTFNSEYDNGIYNFPICSRHERLGHPTQKPLELMNELIIKHSKENDIVLDAFAGSGTTGHSCIINNRNYILIEKNPEYFKIIEERINKLNDN